MRRASIGDGPADRRRVVGAMDGVFALTERERGCPHGVSAAAAGNDIRQVRLVVLDLGRRCPGRVQIFALNER
jgi:hypothetical protein